MGRTVDNNFVTLFFSKLYEAHTLQLPFTNSEEFEIYATAVDFV